MKKTSRLSIAILALVFLVSACGGSSSQAVNSSTAKQNVTLMLDWTPNTNHNGIYLAQQRGYYAKAGLNVKIVQPGEQDGLASLGAGSVDFAVSVQEALIPAREQGVPVVSIGAILSTNTSSLMSLASAGIKRPKDLEGKTYGGSGSQLETQIISSLVKCDGGDPSKVKFVNADTSNYQTGLQQHQYDTAWVFNGWEAINMKQQNIPVNTISFSDYLNCIPDWYTPLIATNENEIAKHPDIVKAFMDATAHGYQDAIRDPDAASSALLNGAPELDAKLVNESSTYLSKYYAKTGQPWGVQDRNTWVRFAQFLQTAGVIDKPLDIDAAFTNKFLPTTSS